MQKHIQSLAQSPDPNNKNWAGLLEKVFSEKDNKIFSNGQQICIVWGWAFNNDQIQRPIIAEEKEEIPEVQPVEEPLVIEVVFRVPKRVCSTSELATRFIISADSPYFFYQITNVLTDYER